MQPCVALHLTTPAPPLLRGKGPPEVLLAVSLILPLCWRLPLPPLFISSMALYPPLHKPHLCVPPQLYWDIIDFYHCVSLRCKTWWFDKHKNCEMIATIGLVNTSKASHTTSLTGLSSSLQTKFMLIKAWVTFSLITPSVLFIYILACVLTLMWYILVCAIFLLLSVSPTDRIFSRV